MMSTNWLEKIVNSKFEEIKRIREKYPLRALEEKIVRLKPPWRMRDFLKRFPPGIIAEIKRASPSVGNFPASVNGVGELARAYESGGAAAISVVTEERYFRGSWRDLEMVRKEVSLPLLMKDFVIDEYQIYLARALGASSILLIVQILDKEKLNYFMKLSQDLALEPLVEVHNEEDLGRALEVGAGFIGINNRDLKTLQINLEVTYNLFPKIPSSCMVVSESGIKTAEQIQGLWELGVRGFLIGEALLCDSHPARRLQEFRGEIGNRNLTSNLLFYNQKGEKNGN